MHDSFGMRCGQGAGHLQGNLQCFIQRQRFIAQICTQRHTLDILLGNEVVGAFVSDLIDGNDVGMIQA